MEAFCAAAAVNFIVNKTFSLSHDVFYVLLLHLVSLLLSHHPDPPKRSPPQLEFQTELCRSIRRWKKKGPRSPSSSSPSSRLSLEGQQVVVFSRKLWIPNSSSSNHLLSSSFVVAAAMYGTDLVKKITFSSSPRSTIEGFLKGNL